MQREHGRGQYQMRKFDLSFSHMSHKQSTANTTPNFDFGPVLQNDQPGPAISGGWQDAMNTCGSFCCTHKRTSVGLREVIRNWGLHAHVDDCLSPHLYGPPAAAPCHPQCSVSWCHEGGKSRLINNLLKKAVKSLQTYADSFGGLIETVCGRELLGSLPSSHILYPPWMEDVLSARHRCRTFRHVHHS